jgi:DNA polymerase III delta subunit
MQLAELRKTIIDKELNNYYMFVGNEIKVMDTYIKQIVDTFNLEPIRVDSLATVFSKLTSNNLTDKQKCYIISNDDDFLKAENEKVWDKMKDLNFKCVVIMIYNTMDKRTKFFKYHNDRDLMTEFEPLASEVLIKYITKEIDLTKDYCEELIGICAGNLNKILLEVNKIKCLSDSCDISANKAYNQLIEEQVIYVPAKDLLFPFIDAVCMGNVQLSYTIWNKIKGVENSMAILSLLYSNFRNTLSLQLAGNVKGVCELTGLTPFQIQLAKPRLGIFTKEELINIIKTVRKVEKGIKTGWIDETIAIKYVLTQIFKEV